MNTPNKPTSAKAPLGALLITCMLTFTNNGMQRANTTPPSLAEMLHNDAFSVGRAFAKKRESDHALFSLISEAVGGIMIMPTILARPSVSPDQLVALGGATACCCAAYHNCSEMCLPKNDDVLEKLGEIIILQDVLQRVKTTNNATELNSIISELQSTNGTLPKPGVPSFMEKTAHTAKSRFFAMRTAKDQQACGLGTMSCFCQPCNPTKEDMLRDIYDAAQARFKKD